MPSLLRRSLTALVAALAAATTGALPSASDWSALAKLPDLSDGMPSWMLITHNALEILVMPGRITMLGEGDGLHSYLTVGRIMTYRTELPTD